MSTSYSPSRSPASFRMALGGGGVSRLRSSASKKPPEPLRRAVADCLSTAAPTNPEASRTLREYLTTHATIDLAYVVILEHTLAERERRKDSHSSTFRSRARPLFQYQHYSEQQPLRLNPVEVCEVIAAVHSEAPSANSNLSTTSSKLRHNGRPSMDVAVSVLVKLVIDMYVLDSETAAPLTLSMLEDILNSPRLMSKARAFDLILNLGVHGHLLEPPAPDGSAAIEELSKEVYFENGAQISSMGKKISNNLNKRENSPAID